MRANTLFQFSLAGILTGIFFGGFVAQYLPLRFYLFAFVITALCSLLMLRYASDGLFLSVITLALGILIFGLFRYGAIGLNPGESDRWFRSLVLYPVMFTVGLLAQRTSRVEVIKNGVLHLAVLSAIVALVERSSGQRLITARVFSGDLSRNGGLRSNALTEQPLVLATLLTCAIAVLLLARRSPVRHRSPYEASLAVRAVTLSVLMAGIWATGSRGAIAVCAVLFLLATLLSWRRSTIIRTRLFGVLAVVLASSGLIVYSLIAYRSGRVLQSATADGASAEYRRVIYGFGVDSLVSHPWGWGIGGLPPGVYLVDSRFGTIDVAKTIDSEFVRATVDFGFIGLIILGLLIYIATTRGRLISSSGFMVFSLLLCGTFVALHSWASVGSLLFLLSGCCLGTRTPQYPSTRSYSMSTPASASPISL